MRLTSRDRSLFSSLALFGRLTTSQIARLLQMHLKVLQRRLRKLRQADYIRCIQLPNFGLGRGEYLWYLSGQGADFIGARFSKPRLTMHQTHQIDSNSLLIDVLKSFDDGEMACSALPEHFMRQASLAAIPDGSFLISAGGNSALFLLENDSGSEILSSLSLHDDMELKVITYSRMFEENEVGFFQRHFCKAGSLNRFRLLIVTTDARRLDAIARVAVEHDESGFVWITRRRSLRQNGIKGNIWQIPVTSEHGRCIVGRD